jgi:high-affinity iron transporter
MALLVVVREAFEAVVVVAALLAVLKKLEQEAHARVVHAGWISALVAGAMSFFLGQQLLAGANREWMEGVVALVAVAMLLYAAFWLNARTNLSRYMGDLRVRMQGALGQGSAVGLFFIAFSAAFREFFETALFLEGLSIDSRAGALWGGLAGLGVMAGVVMLIRRVGYRLPMKPLFKASTVLLVATAVVLLGKGIHALQEVGALPLRPLPLPTLEPLGIFPDALSLLPQVVLALAPFAWKWLGQRGSGGVAPNASDAQRN